MMILSIPMMDNAIKFSHHDSIIRIETSQKKNKLFVSVKDTGIGIPKEDLKLIWDRFYKSDLSRGKDKKGTGLGLSICRNILEKCDAEIFYSKSFALKGACFTVRFPRKRS